MSHGLEFQGVEAVFGNFQLSIDATLLGGVTGVFGTSGAGKTTLLEIVAGIKKPEKGRLVLQGRVLLDCDHGIFVPSRQRNIGYVPQDLALFPHLTVEANVRYGERRHGGVRRSSLEQICEILEIGDKLSRYPSELSGGEEQRVAFARALMTQPSILLLDEPLRGLHHELQMKIIEFLALINKEFALPMLYVTHSPLELVTLCQEALILNQGNVVGLGKPSDYFMETTAVTYNLKPGQVG